MTKNPGIITVDTTPGSNYKKKYNVRAVGPGNKYFEVQLPRQIVQMEAERKGLTVEEFLKYYQIEALYDTFPGVHYHFVEREEIKRE